LARALALLDRRAPADQKRIAIAQATAGIRYASAVLFSSHRNSYGIWSPETPALLYCHFYFARRTSKEGPQSAMTRHW
jgi:hypothetical protein